MNSISQDEYDRMVEQRLTEAYGVSPTFSPPSAVCTPCTQDAGAWLTGRTSVIISDRERVYLEQAAQIGRLPPRARYWRKVWEYRLGLTTEPHEPEEEARGYVELARTAYERMMADALYWSSTPPATTQPPQALPHVDRNNRPEIEHIQPVRISRCKSAPESEPAPETEEEAAPVDYEAPWAAAMAKVKMWD